MKTTEMRALSAEELQNELLALRKEEFNLRVQKTTGQLAQTHQMRRVSRSIARVKTLLSEKKRTEQ